MNVTVEDDDVGGDVEDKLGALLDEDDGEALGLEVGRLAAARAGARPGSGRVKKVSQRAASRSWIGVRGVRAASGASKSRGSKTRWLV